MRQLSYRRTALAGLTLTLLNMPVAAQEARLSVTAERVARHTCPSAECGVVGHLIQGEKVVVLERSLGWARITKHYPAGCKDGASQWVDYGNVACEAKNGIADGTFAEWISVSALDDPKAAKGPGGLTEAEQLVANSDHFSEHRVAFGEAVEALIADGTCTPKDFEESGGWLKATGALLEKPVYFTYCGGWSAANRYYLDVKTGGIAQR